MFFVFVTYPLDNIATFDPFVNV